jgi:hypothetical protein
VKALDCALCIKLNEVISYLPQRLQANVNPETNLLDSVTLDDIIIPLTQNFFYYEGEEGGERSSGAYVFRPRDNSLTPLSAINISTITGT